MAENIAITPGNGDIIAADEISTVKYQRVKLISGIDGINDGDIAATNPLPVDIKSAIPAGTNAIGKLAANDGVDIGDVDVASSALPIGASTSANQTTIVGHVDGIEALLGTIDADTSSIDSKITACNTGSVDINDISKGVQTNDVKVTLDSEAVAVTNTGLTELAAAINTSQLDVNIATDSVGIGGGTQYTEGDIDATITGDALIAEGTSDTLKAVRCDDDGALHVSDGGNSITVDGAVTANAGTNLNTSALATEAGGNLAAIKTAVEILDNAVDGNEVQVDVVASLPAGTNAIGKLAANTGVDIGDVDVTSITPGTAAANLGKAEDVAHSSGDVGVMPLAVRNDTLAALGGTDGDYAPLQVNASGALFVNKLNRTANGTAHAAGEISAHTDSSIITTAGYNQITIYWDITAITGTWKLILRTYDSDSNEYYEIMESADKTAVSDNRYTFPICDPIVDIRLQEEAAGAMTSSVRYHLRA